MSKLTIKTNHNWHNFLYGYELTEKERLEFDYMEDINEGTFFRYKNWVYDVGEFFTTSELLFDDNLLKNWDGYQSESSFSGIVIKYSEDCEQYQVGTYFS